MIKKVVLQPYWYEMYCDKCGEVMEIIDENKHAVPREYIYQCPKCEFVAITTKNLGVTRNDVIVTEVVEEKDIDV